MTYFATLRANRSRWAALVVIAVAVLGMLAMAARPAAADPWVPGAPAPQGTIGNISGAEKWCGPPWDAGTCPPQSAQARFNLDLVPWFSTPDGIVSDGNGLMTLGTAMYNQDSANVGIWCYGPVWLFGPVPYLLPLVTRIKRTGPGNQPPAAAADADVSFECPATYIDPGLPFPFFKLFVPVKWWVHKKVSGGSDRGWVYITATDGSFNPVKVLVTTATYSHSLDICTPYSDHESCNPAAGASGGIPSQEDLATLSSQYKVQFRQELEKLLN